MPATGLLFSDYFLSSGVEDLPEWAALTPERCGAARAVIARVVAGLEASASPNESVTERLALEPLLDLLGWGARLTQQSLSPTGRADVPDYLLFADADARDRALALPHDHGRYAVAATFVEAKRWAAPLDRAPGGVAPSTQMLRYLSLAEVQSDQRIRFAVLTNGRRWRLYDQKARSRAEEFFEVDLALAAYPDLATDPAEAERALRLFLLFFAAPAWARDAAGRTLHERALGESRRYEERVTRALADVVFGRVFRDLAAALRRHDPQAGDGAAYLAELREATLIYLYRLLFTLFAEDRRLLPTWNRPDGLTEMRDQIAVHADGRLALSERRANFDGDLRDLWRQIDEGDDSVGVPPYNGGLFRGGRPILDRARIPDAEFAPILDALSRSDLPLARKRINYRDLSVQHLGSVYERLLEYELAVEGGELVQRPNPFARKTSGSYYTPEELVLLIIGRTLQPLIEERRQAFRDLPARAGAAELDAADPASRILDLTVLDPAMGSGHFLVSLVDWLADRVLEAMAEAAALRPDHPSPLATRLDAIAAHIGAEAERHGWALPVGGLEPRQLVRRIILKRVVHGVDKNPMAVELAKLSLWLHTFTVGAPLSFLDHHLRVGDSLFGEWVRDAQDFMAARGGMMAGALTTGARQAAQAMLAIEDMSDADIQEVHASADSFAGVEEATAPLNAILSLVQAWRWRSSSSPARGRASRSSPVHGGGDRDAAGGGASEARERTPAALFNAVLDGSEGDTAAIALGAAEPRGADARALVRDLRAIAAREGFLHWQVAFPNRWDAWQEKQPVGGFDAVIGNPPWDRFEFEEVPWFADRDRSIALERIKERRKTLIQQLRQTKPELYAEFEEAQARQAAAASVAKKSGGYSLLNTGKLNLYKLFVERALQLIRPRGIVGLLTPIGIGTDHSVADFVGGMTTSSRLSAFIAFENKGRWLFADVHSEDQPTVFVAGGPERAFPDFEYAVKLHEVPSDVSLSAPIRLTAATLTAVNPNTGTMPVFRSMRDLALLAKLYQSHPLLIEGTGKNEHPLFPIKYRQMVNLTSRSGGFRTEKMLTENEGAWPVAGGEYASGTGRWLRLYEGKMVSLFNHRYAGVRGNPLSVSGQGVSVHSSEDQLSSPDFLPVPRYWIAESDASPDFEWAIGFNDVCNTNNARSLISAIVPKGAYGNSLPLLTSTTRSLDDLIRLQANFGSFVTDYVARQKIQSRHLSKYILAQLPVIPPSAYATRFGPKTAAEIVREDVLALTYTAHDMAPFARDLGHDGPPFAWDEDDRRTRRARLDALFFHLYGLDRDDADYILSTFPIVERQDRAAHGRYLTRDLVLAWMNALAAGEPDAQIVLPPPARQPATSG